LGWEGTKVNFLGIFSWKQKKKPYSARKITWDKTNWKPSPSFRNLLGTLLQKKGKKTQKDQKNWIQKTNIHEYRDGSIFPLLTK